MNRSALLGSYGGGRVRVIAPWLSCLVAACAVAIASTGGSASAQPTLAAALSFDVGGQPHSVAMADLNGDGNLDLATANNYNYYGGPVSVLLGNGDGTLDSRVDYGAGLGARFLAVADLNRDDIPDLVVANYSDGNVSVVLGNGDGTFGAAVTYPADRYYGSVCIAIGDVNADGNPDIVMPNQNFWFTLSVLPGNGDGTFGPRLDHGQGYGLVSVAIVELNADGKPDLVACTTSFTVLILLGNGDGTFRAGPEYPAGRYPVSVAIGDLNRDGSTDIAIANRESNAASVLLGDGVGGFGERVEYGTGGSPVSVGIEDVSGDGNLDLILANEGSNSVSVLTGHGDGTFAARMDYAVGREPSSTAIGDLNGDGRPDLAVANSRGNSWSESVPSVSVLLGQEDGTFGARWDYGNGWCRHVGVGDVNGDGKPDLAVLSGYPRSMSVLLGEGDGTFLWMEDHPTGAEPGCAAIGDLSGDGNPDVAVANSQDHAVSVYLGQGGGRLGAPTAFATGYYPYSVALGDLNADGKPDLVTANGGAHSVSVLLGNGDGTFAERTDLATGRYPETAAIADLNRDGAPDIVVASRGSSCVSVLLGRGDGSFAPCADFGTGDSPNALAVGDVNGDGRPDVATSNYSSVSVLLGDGNGGFAPGADLGTGLEPSGIAIADLTGDGRADLAVAHGRSNTLTILEGHGDGTFGPAVDYLTGDRPHSIVVADVDQDGSPDLAVANGGTVSVFRNTAAAYSVLQAAVDLDPNTINLRSRAPWVTAYIEPSGFDPAGIVFSSLRLAGSIPAAPKFGTIGDHNGNGAPDLMVKFSREGLDQLLTPGLVELEVTGSLVTGEEFRGSDEVRVLDPPDPHLSASVAPNPLNPVGVLTFQTTIRGPVSVHVFDLQGRLVRALLEAPHWPAGVHEMTIDARADDGEPLASGLYFYRVRTAEGIVNGRLAILK